MLTNEWHQKSKRWGHPLHSMCSYMGMFPPRLPHYFIQKFTRRGDVVLDPFCGRGTTPLQACVEGRIGIGVDPNPLAYALTLAKVKPPDPAALRNRIDDLSNDMFFGDAGDQPSGIRLLFHDHTLSQLVFLKQTLDRSDRTDAFILGVLLGMLHGGAQGAGAKTRVRRRSDTATFLSIPMPDTFSTSENHIEEYVRGKKLQAPRLDVFASLRLRVERLLRLGLPKTEGRIWNARIQELRELPDPALKRKKIQLIFSSPPCLKALKHGVYKWIRLWLLDENPDDLDDRLDQHRKLDDYLDFMLEACRILYRVTAPGGVCALMIGDVQKGKQEPIRLAEEVWKHLKRKQTRWKLAEILEDFVPARAGAARIQGEAKGGRVALVDRILVMYKDTYKELVDHVPW